MQCAADGGGRFSEIAAQARKELLQARHDGLCAGPSQHARRWVLRYLMLQRRFQDAWYPLFQLKMLERSGENCLYCRLTLATHCFFSKTRDFVTRYVLACPRCGFIQDSRSRTPVAVKQTDCCFLIAVPKSALSFTSFAGSIWAGYAPDKCILEPCNPHSSEGYIALRLPKTIPIGPLYLSIGLIVGFDVIMLERKIREGTLTSG